VEIAATALGPLGAGGVLGLRGLVVTPVRTRFQCEGWGHLPALWEQGLLDQPMVDIALAEAFEERRNGNAAVVRRLVSFLALTLLAVSETAGLATAAALASRSGAVRPATTGRGAPDAAR
jgi:hypothetical protein